MNSGADVQTGSSTAAAVSVSEALRTRQSARAFLPTPVPLSTITELLELARWAPSGSNIQPWRVHALTGAPLQAVVNETLGMAMQGQAPEQEYLYYANPLPEPYLSRRRANGWGLYGHLGIAKGDRMASAKQALANFAFFGAPVGLFFFIDAGLAQGSWLDYGMFLQSFMLAARERGLHTCPQAAWLPYHELARRHCGVDAGWTLVCGMALGHLNPAEHVNGFRTPRLSPGDFLSASGFGEVS